MHICLTSSFALFSVSVHLIDKQCIAFDFVNFEVKSLCKSHSLLATRTQLEGVQVVNDLRETRVCRAEKFLDEELVFRVNKKLLHRS